MQRCKKSSGLAKKSQASLENFRTASNVGMPYVIPFDSAVFFFNTIDSDRIKGLTPRGITTPVLYSNLWNFKFFWREIWNPIENIAAMNFWKIKDDCNGKFRLGSLDEKPDV